jgi:hypothetical protein
MCGFSPAPFLRFSEAPALYFSIEKFNIGMLSIRKYFPSRELGKQDRSD